MENSRNNYNNIQHNNVDSTSKTGSMYRALYQSNKADTVSFKGGKPAGIDAMKELLRGLSDLMQKGHDNVIKEAMDLVAAGEINKAIDFVAQHKLPNGSIKEMENETRILARNWESSQKTYYKKSL